VRPQVRQQDAARLRGVGNAVYQGNKNITRPTPEKEEKLDRYDNFDGTPIKNPNGEWVEYAAAQAIIAELEQKLAEVESETRKVFDDWSTLKAYSNVQDNKLAAAQATIAELENELANKKKDNRKLHLLQDELVEIRNDLKADLAAAQARLKRLGEGGWHAVMQIESVIKSAKLSHGEIGGLKEAVFRLKAALTAKEE
jgi:chromosome segregation ATPase